MTRAPTALGLSLTAVVTAVVAAVGVSALAKDGPAQLAPISDASGFAWLDGDDTIAHTVERSAVQKGVQRSGHPRDLIPPIDEPRFFASEIEAVEALNLAAEDRVLGIEVDGDARAYLTRILDRHEVVNDTIGGQPIAILW